MFDTLKFVRALRDGGSFTPEQAERLSGTLSDAISGEVAARSDPEVIETKLGQRIGDLRAKLKQDMSDLRLSLVGEIRTLDAKIEAAKADTIK